MHLKKYFLMILVIVLLFDESTHASDIEEETSDSSPTLSRKRVNREQSSSDTCKKLARLKPLAATKSLREIANVDGTGFSHCYIARLDSVIPRLGKHLTLQDLGRLACVSRGCLRAMFYETVNPWAGKMISFNLSAESDRGLMTCGYPLQHNPIELVNDSHHPDRLAGNMTRFFNWWQQSQPSHLAIILDHRDDGDGILGDDPPWCIANENAIRLFVSNWSERENKLPAVASLRLAEVWRLSEETQNEFDEVLHHIAFQVTHLTLTDCIGSRLIFHTKLKNLRSVTLENYPEEEEEMDIDIIESLADANVVREITLKNIQVFSAEMIGRDRPLVLPCDSESLRLYNVKFLLCVDRGGDPEADLDQYVACYKRYLDSFTLLSKLQCLETKGCLFRLVSRAGDLLPDSHPFSQAIAKHSYNDFQAAFGHIPHLVLDWSEDTPIDQVPEPLGTAAMQLDDEAREPTFEELLDQWAGEFEALLK